MQPVTDINRLLERIFNQHYPNHRINTSYTCTGKHTQTWSGMVFHTWLAEMYDSGILTCTNRLSPPIGLVGRARKATTLGDTNMLPDGGMTVPADMQLRVTQQNMQLSS